MNNLCVTGILAMVGGILFLIGLVILLRTRSFIAGAQPTKGTVVHMNYSSDSDGSGYAPVFQFKAMNGETVQVAERIYSNPPRFKTGQEVDVLYDPQDPHKARINKGFDLYFTPALLGGMGILFFGIGIVLMFIKF